MSDTNNSDFIKVDLDGAESIEFLGYDTSIFEFPIFRALDGEGTDVGYICEFAPDTLRKVRAFACVKPEWGKDGDDTMMGICPNERIVGTLLCLAYPKGIKHPVADFKGIENAVEGKKTLPLISEDDAKQVLSYADEGRDWLGRKLGKGA